MTFVSSLIDVLLVNGPVRRSEARDDSAVWNERVEAFLRERHVIGRAAWPLLDLDPEDFVAHLARHLPDDAFDSEGKPSKSVEALHVSDLYLAAACLAGISNAADTLHREHLSQIPLFVARVMRGQDSSKVDDLVQAVSEKLLVAEEGRKGRLAEYGGHGPLGGFIRVVSTRMALRIVKKADDLSVDGDAPEVPVGKEPELDHLRVHYREDFKVAFEAAFQKLSKEQRLLLRLHSSGTLRGDDIAKMLGIDRSTAMRKLARAREVLFDATRAGLMAKVGISSTEFESIARAVKSQIDLTLSRVLATKP